jgi:hypothetical protein
VPAPPGPARSRPLAIFYRLVAGEAIVNGDRDAVVLVGLRLPDGGADGGFGGAGGSFDDAIGDAGDLLVGTAGVLIRVLALALPLGLIGVVAWLVARALRRRGRESALA